MPSSSLPPEAQDKVKQFDPLVLDRTVIAIPLLNMMAADLKRIEEALKAEPALADKFNVAIVFNKKFSGGAKAARLRVIKMIEEQEDQALEDFAARVAMADDASLDEHQSSLDLLKRAIADKVVGPLRTGAPRRPQAPHIYARLHDAIIRRLLSANERLAVKNAKSAPIHLADPPRYDIIIDLNLEYPEGRAGAREWVIDHFPKAKRQVKVRDDGQVINLAKGRVTSQYLFARLEARAISRLVAMDMANAEKKARKIEAEKAAQATDGKTKKQQTPGSRMQVDPIKCRAIFHIWPDFEVSACLNKSIATVKADAAHNSFSALGAGITWAVMDTGIDGAHQHFVKHGNVDQTSTWHKDFTTDGGSPFVDENGHGTHVAGIIGGEWSPPPDGPAEAIAVSRYLKEHTQDVAYQQTKLATLRGIAPQCKLVSLRVLDENGKGAVSNLIAAIDHIQEINGYGRRLLIHGVNLSLGYTFEPEWFACGQSPLCVEVDRLVKSGVVVVAAAGNTGFGTLKAATGPTTAGMALTINDPGNADLAITVGSTHRNMPHVYGVSYFSSKGPTGDGRLKPDLVAPGEKITSCATGNLKKEGARGQECHYVETSGTSMAAPHVSGVIAGFLSVRREFIGKAERVKELFVSTATDLRRDRYFQGAGLVDLMRAIQSV